MLIGLITMWFIIYVYIQVIKSMSIKGIKAETFFFFFDVLYVSELLGMIQVYRYFKRKENFIVPMHWTVASMKRIL